MERPALPDIRSGTIVVIPSISTSTDELRRTPAAEYLEERLLFMLLLLRRPNVRIVYVTALAIDPEIVDYHLRLVADPGARARLELVALDAPGPEALTGKLLDRPDAVARIRGLAGPPDQAQLLCYKVTRAEHRLAAALGLTLDGPEERHLGFDTKSAARRLARRTGVPVLDGAEDLRSVEAVEQALDRLRARRPTARAALVKLDRSFAGRGNAIVPLDQPLSPLTDARVEFVAPDEGWATYAPKIAGGGAVVEELLTGPGLASPGVQLQIAAGSPARIVSSIDMVLGGEHEQRYTGCRFPPAAAHRRAVHEAAERLGEALAREGLLGWFGLDFLVVGRTSGLELYLSEINLRMGGGTHPFWLALLAGDGDYDATSGELRIGGRSKAFVATDDVRSQRLVGCTPGSVVERIDRAGLAFDPRRGEGVLLQFLGPVTEFGMLGLTCVADSLELAERLRREAVAALDR